jgi:hypothetical protein
MCRSSPPPVFQIKKGDFMSSTPSVSSQPPAGGPPAAPAKSGAVKIILWIVGIFASLVVLCIVGVVVISAIFFHKAKQAGLDSDLMKKNPALAIAKMAVTANADTELVSSDDNAGTIVVRDKKTGKIVTMKFDPEKKSMVVIDENGKTATVQVDSSKNSLVVTDAQGKTATITGDAQGGNVEVKGPDGTFKAGANADKAPSWVPVYPGATPQSNFSASSNGEQTGSYSFTTKDGVDKILAYYDSALKSSGFKTSNTTNNTNGKITGMVSGTADNDKRTVLVIAGSDDNGIKVAVTFNSKP